MPWFWLMHQSKIDNAKTAQWTFLDHPLFGEFLKEAIHIVVMLKDTPWATVRRVLETFKETGRCMHADIYIPAEHWKAPGKEQ